MCKSRAPRKPVAEVPHGIVDNRYRHADFQPRAHCRVETVVQYPAEQSRTGRGRRLDIAQRGAAIYLFDVQQGAAPAAKTQLGIDGLGGAVGGPHHPGGLRVDPQHCEDQPEVLGAGVRGHAHRLYGTSREVHRNRVSRAEPVEALRALVERGHRGYEPRLGGAWTQAGNDEQAERIAGRIGGKPCRKPFGPAGLEALSTDFHAGSQHSQNRGLVPRPANAGGRLPPHDGPVANQHREFEGIALPDDGRIGGDIRQGRIAGGARTQDQPAGGLVEVGVRGGCLFRGRFGIGRLIRGRDRDPRSPQAAEGCVQGQRFPRRPGHDDDLGSQLHVAQVGAGEQLVQRARNVLCCAVAVDDAVRREKAGAEGDLHPGTLREPDEGFGEGQLLDGEPGGGGEEAAGLGVDADFARQPRHVVGVLRGEPGRRDAPASHAAGRIVARSRRPSGAGPRISRPPPHRIIPPPPRIIPPTPTRTGARPPLLPPRATPPRPSSAPRFRTSRCRRRKPREPRSPR